MGRLLVVSTDRSRFILPPVAIETTSVSRWPVVSGRDIRSIRSCTARLLQSYKTEPIRTSSHICSRTVAIINQPNQPRQREITLLTGNSTPSTTNSHVMMRYGIPRCSGLGSLLWAFKYSFLFIWILHISIMLNSSLSLMYKYITKSAHFALVHPPTNEQRSLHSIPGKPSLPDASVLLTSLMSGSLKLSA